MGNFRFKASALAYGGLGALGLSILALPSGAQAASVGCANFSSFASNNFTSGSFTGFTTPFLAARTATFDAGDQLQFVVQNNDGDGDDASIIGRLGNATTGSSQTANTNGGTVTINITIATSGSITVGAIVDNPSVTTGELDITSASCTPATTSSNNNSTSQETTSQSVNNAVSRSQTTVIQQNIGARTATVIGSAGAGGAPTGGVGGAGAGSTGGTGGGGTGGSGSSGGSPGTGTGGGGADDDTASFAGFTANSTVSDDDRRAVLRRIAMRASFDSSVYAQSLYETAELGLGPTDQGTVGGTSGTDGRMALATTSPITLWGHGSYTSVDNDYNNGSTDSRYDGDVWGYNIGADYRFDNGFIAGLSVGYNDTDLTTTFNNGSYEESAWVLSPYAIYRPLQDVTVTAEFGYSQGDIDVTRSNGSVTGATDSVLWYGSITAAYGYRPSEDMPLTLSPSIGLLAARKDIDSYTESNGTFVDSSRSNTRQIKPGIEATYDITVNTLVLTPFVETGIVHDFTDELNNDKTAFNIGGGLRISDSATGLNGALEASYLAGRTDYQEYTIAGTISYGFELRDLEGQPIGLVSPFFGSDVDEYGNQSVIGGFGFAMQGVDSKLSLAHDVSQNDVAESTICIDMVMKF